MRSKRAYGYATEPTIAIEANQLEAAIKAAGLDPEAPASFAVWDAWQVDGLGAALIVLEEGISVTKQQPTLLAELRTRAETLTSELHAISVEIETQIESYRRANQMLASAGMHSDPREVHAARASLLLAKRRVDELRAARQRVGEQCNTAKIRYCEAETSVRIARQNLARLDQPLIEGHARRKLGLGDITRLRKTNRAILATYGELEGETTP